MMKKILEKLELNVQWIALALGLAFVIYAAYAYLLDPPVKTEVAGRTVGPGDVDDAIWDAVGTQLQDKLKGQKPPKVESPDLIKLFTDAIDYRNKPLSQDMLVAAFPSSKDLPQLPGTNPPGQQPGPGGTPVPNKGYAGPVTGLPELIAPKLNTFRSGMSAVLPPAQNGQDNNNPAQPVSTNDVTWVTVRGEIDVDALSKAFDDKKIPSPAKTSFIQLLMEREEKMPDGTWGNHTIVPHIKTTDVPAMPAMTDQPGSQYAYLQWAEQHTAELMQPAFYKVIKGDQWAVPGEQVINANAQPTAAFDPTQWIDAKPADIEAQHFTNEQKQAIFKARSDRNKQNAKGKSSGRSSRGPVDEGGPAGPGGAPPGAPRAPNDAGRPPGGPPPGAMGGPRGYRPPPGANITGEPDDGAMGDMGMPAPQQAAVNFPMPIGAFDPKEWLKANPTKTTITVWADDETAQPGHTYHYKLSYAIKSPLFNTYNLTKNEKLLKTYAILSPSSAWTEEVELLSTVNFWVVRPPRAGGSVDVQVFRWQAGETKSKQFSVSPGDMIGQKDGEVDFTSGWTLVDVQYDPRSGDQYILVMDPTGLTHHRDFKTDSADPKLKSWKEQATVASAAPVSGGVAAR